MICLFFIIPLVINAQHPGGSFSGKSYVLYGETEIVLKDSSKVICHDKIDGTKLGKTGIDYKNVDRIRLVKTSLKGFNSANGTIYKFVQVKNKPQLVKILIETPRVSFYQERPKMTGGGHNALGQFQAHGVSDGKLFITKNNSEEALELYADKITKLFSDCPRLIQFQKDKELRKKLTLRRIGYIYNVDCKEATEEDIEKEDHAFNEYVVSQENK